MSVPYRVITAAVGLRINALVGSTADALQTSYTTSPLTTAEFQSTIFPFAGVKGAVLNGEERLAQKIANNADDPLRQYMANTTANLANLSALPSVSTNSKPIIGVWGAVKDATSGQVCSAPNGTNGITLDMVRRRAINSGTEFVCPVYWCAFVGGTIEHTRTNVVIECCTYSRSDQETILEANGDILLSDALEPDYINEAVAILVRDDEFMEQARLYAQRAANSLIGNLGTVEGVAATN